MEHYRLYCISKIPSLRVLDFERITLSERLAAKEMFGEDKGQEFVEEIKKKQQLQQQKNSLSKEEKARREKALQLKVMIEQAETLEEITRIEEEMKKGKYDEVLLENEM
jgi:U2 small nuclear ribonucleoprotein A'